MSYTLDFSAPIIAVVEVKPNKLSDGLVDNVLQKCTQQG